MAIFKPSALGPVSYRRMLTACAARAVAIVCLWLWCAAAVGQTDGAVAVGSDSTFTVESFRPLPNDVSAFVDAVRDLNGEACALVKVVAPPDFAFSSPLGIVKRTDGVGEIWLYLPKGTKQLTLKHPQWGVLRDYPLGQKLESRMTYELRVALPKAPIVERHDTVVFTQTVVDTVTVAPVRRVMPLRAYALLTAAVHEGGPSWGLMLALMRRHGGYVHVGTNLRSAPDAVGSCDGSGYVSASGRTPYYTGRTHTASFAVTAGLIHRLCSWLSIFEGVGYGRHTTSWQLADSEGGGWLRNDDGTHKGMAAELGVVASVGRVSVSASAVTIGGKAWGGCVGVGVRIFKE